MLRQILLAILTLMLVAAIAPDARAALCFQYTKSGGGVSVGQVDVPRPNTCVTFALYEVGTNPASTLLGAGTASLCTSTDSPMVIYHYTYEGCRPLGADNYWESATCRLQLDHNSNLPTQFSVCRGSLISGKPGQVGKASNFFNQDDLVITRCDSNDIKFRVPGGTVSECGRGRLRLEGSDLNDDAGKATSRDADQSSPSP